MKVWEKILPVFLVFLITNLTAQTVAYPLVAQLIDTRISTEEKIEYVRVTIDSLKRHQPSEALRLIDTSFTILSSTLTTQQKGTLHLLKGDISTRTGDLAAARSDYGKAIDKFQLLNDYKQLDLSYNKIGWIHIKEGKYQLARTLFQTGLKLAQDHELSNRVADNYNDIGVSYHYQKAYEQAISNYLKATALREQSGYKKGLVISYNNLGVIYKLNKDTTNALNYYTKGTLLAESIPDSSRMVSFNINIGRLYLHPNTAATAIPYFDKALLIAQKIDNKRKIAICEYNLGEAYEFQGQYDKATIQFKKAIQQFEELGEEKNKIGTIYELGKTLTLAGHHKKGLAHMLQAHELAQTTDMVFVHELNKIAAAYAQLKQPSKAYDYLKQYSLVKDSLESIKIQERISQLQTHYEAEFKAKEKEQEITLLNQQKGYFKKLLIFSLIFSFLVLGLFILLIIYSRKKKRLNRELTKRNNIIYSKNQELKRLNKELQIAKDLSDKSAKIKEEFLASMSHEIRTPMNAVIGMTNILIDEEPREDQIENLKTLKFSAKNLLTLINDVLDFSKIEAGKIILEQVDFSIERLLENVIETFKLSKSKNNVNIILEQNLELFTFHLKGDTTRLTQIFTNLLGNALKFTTEGHVKLIARILKQTPKRVTLFFAVEDTGIGIPKEKFEHIFQSFTQAADNTTRLYGGTGLGLSITKNLVELHKSKIQLSSEVGVGSTFAFEATFEIGKPLGKQTKAKIENNLSIKVGLENRRILLAEDNKINQLVAKKILSKWKVKLDIANDGLEVLNYVKNNYYDVILMDIQMPNMNGYEATNAIRALPTNKANTPIIALTASDYSIARNIKNSGMNDFLTKPFNPNILHTRICQVIAEQEALV